MIDNITASNDKIVKATINGVDIFVPRAAILARDGDIPTRIADWIAAGNVLPDYVEPALVEDDYARAIQSTIDEEARKHGYQDGFAMAGYATCPIYGAQAQEFINWRGKVWQQAYTELKIVKNKEKAPPISTEDFVKTLEKPEITRG